MYEQMGKITVLISHAILLKLSSNSNPWALYQFNYMLQLKFKSKLYPKPPIQSQTQAYLQALRILCTIAVNSFLWKSSYILLLFTCNLKPKHTPALLSNPTIPPNPSFLLQPIFYLLCFCSCSHIPLWLPFMRIYWHKAWISASTMACAAKQIYHGKMQKNFCKAHI